ncbi:hypothetical protein [Rhodopirellula baltica]|uniref:hypothetical protein n=1 Tax=Rhodopirellula baltica TaxID=265606 RepID=UPI0013EF007F|nr:hypothetical protein [Rhodopirellula baltica]
MIDSNRTIRHRQQHSSSTEVDKAEMETIKAVPTYKMTNEVLSPLLGQNGRMK